MKSELKNLINLSFGRKKFDQYPGPGEIWRQATNGIGAILQDERIYYKRGTKKFGGKVGTSRQTSQNLVSGEKNSFKN